MRDRTITPAAKSSLAFMMVSFFTQGIGFLITPVITRMMSEGEYGQISLFNSWYEILGVFAMLCLSFGVFNNGMIEFKNDKDVYMNSLLVLSNIATVIVGMFVAILSSIFPNMVGLNKKALVVLFIVFLFQPAYNFWITRNRFEYKYKAVTVVGIVTVILSAILSIVFITIDNVDKALYKIIGQYMPLVICYIAIYILIAYKAKAKIKLSYWKYALKFNIPLIPHYLSIYILSGADRIMIDYFCNDNDVAIYSLAYVVASVVGLVWQSINASLLPYTYEKCEKKEYKCIGNLSTKLLLGYAMICIILMLFIPEIFMILAPNSYQVGIYAAIPVVVGTFYMANYFIFANIVYYYKKPRYVMLASVTSAIINIILNVVFIPIFGYIAAGYTTMIAYLTQSIIDYYAMRRITREQNIDSIYNIKIIIMLDITMLIIAWIMNAIYILNGVRWIIIVLLALMSIFGHRKIIDYFMRKDNV